ncbi:MAG: TraR/DksA family transcriptional regulator [Spirochaeta sp.]|nr:TraR/DksA family transcriptional regulator [Spirochaeta sp.]
MNNDFTAKIKKALLKMKEGILANLASESNEFRELLEDMDPKDLADIAADDFDRKTLEALGTNEINRLRAIEAALGRLENGHFGVCLSCSNKIPRERLEAIPYAVLCIACKSSEERRNR